eukprot:5077598-Pleurochrysis_carterae.AAC.1
MNSTIWPARRRTLALTSTMTLKSVQIWMHMDVFAGRGYPGRNVKYATAPKSKRSAPAPANRSSRVSQVFTSISLQTLSLTRGITGITEGTKGLP